MGVLGHQSVLLIVAPLFHLHVEAANGVSGYGRLGCGDRFVTVGIVQVGDDLEFIGGGLVVLPGLLRCVMADGGDAAQDGQGIGRANHHGTDVIARLARRREIPLVEVEEGAELGVVALAEVIGFADLLLGQMFAVGGDGRREKHGPRDEQRDERTEGETTAAPGDGH